MDDFRKYSGETDPKNQQSIYDLVRSLAGKFDGKSQNELLSAIYREAEKGKRNGTLKNADIDNFAMAISPFLDDKKRKYLAKIVAELKKI